MKRDETLCVVHNSLFYKALVLFIGLTPLLLGFTATCANRSQTVPMAGETD
jgi:hypothetical protein